MGPEGGSFPTSQLIMLILAVVALTVVMFGTRRRIRESRALSGSKPREQSTASKLRQESARDLEQVMLELDQLSRQIHGRIDTKLAKLETLLRDADERIDKLSRLVRASEGSSRRAATLSPTGDGAGPQPQAEKKGGSGGRREQILRLAEGGTPLIEIAREVGITPGEVELVVALHKAHAGEGASAAAVADPSTAAE